MSSRNYGDIEREFYSFLKHYDPMYKAEIIRINISSTFMVRARCKECGGFPHYYYVVRKPFLQRDVRRQIDNQKVFRKFIKRMISNWYLEEQPKYFTDIKDFSFSIIGASFVPILHRARGVGRRFSEEVIEFISCNCGATVWAFNQKSVKSRPEITDRKGKYAYPKRFDY